MTPLLLCFISLAVFEGSLASESTERYNSILQTMAGIIERNPRLRTEFQRNVELTKSDTLPIKFPCNVTDFKSRDVPTTVHKLRPGDIKVVAALGDSITAGNGIGAKSAPEVLLQHRGESWSIGGDRSINQGINTMANVLKKFNPSLKGYSVGFGLPDTENAWFNGAVAGAKAGDLPEEAVTLVDRIKADDRIDFENDWKLITIMIGGNDMCDYCFDRDKYSAENYGKFLQQALDTLHDNIPRALVNLVPMADISDVPFIRTGFLCDILHNALCKCATDSKTRPELRPLQLAFYNKLKDLAEGGRYDTSDDFTVVLQPFLVDQTFPKNEETGVYDPTYIAPDCFHPSRKSHQGFSMLLWNCMLTAVEEKVRSAAPGDLENPMYSCPSKDKPYIFTNKNSNV